MKCKRSMKGDEILEEWEHFPKSFWGKYFYSTFKYFAQNYLQRI